jgi:hypothetical protein
MNSVDVICPSGAGMNQVLDLKDIHTGQRGFVIGNGPSLKMEDLERLAGEITFACNNIYLAFPDTSWRPTYYTVSDPLAAREFGSVVRQLAVRKIFSNSVSDFFTGDSDITWLRQIDYVSDSSSDDFAFSFDLRNGVYHGATTLYIQFQLAFYMGIEEIYLLGVDGDYNLPPKQGKRSGMGVLVEHDAEVNHFHPEYRRKGESWWLADREFQLKTYTFARSVFEACGRRILNASRKSALEVFPRVDFDELLRQ